MPVHHLAALSWPAFRELASDRLIAVLPLGAIEAHGPHLPLGTDIVIAEAMANKGAELLHARGFDVVILPALPAAPAPFAAEFAGTVLPEEMEAEVARLEARMADPNFFTKDPDGFAKAAKQMEAARAEISRMEEEWLELEMLREELEG